MLPAHVPDLPLRGFDPARFVGECAADGQRVRVAALACDATGQTIFLSIVGYETSVGATLARLMKREALGFLPRDDSWNGPTTLSALPISYWLWRADISSTREKHGVAIARAVSITHGLRNPPHIPAAEPRAPNVPPPDPFAQVEATLARLREGKPDPRTYPVRLLLGDIEHDAPTAAAFFGHLKGLRVITLPTLPWIDYLWTTGLTFGVITPLHSLGIRAWQLDGNPESWNALISDGVRRGQLTQMRVTAKDRELLHLQHEQ